MSQPLTDNDLRQVNIFQYWLQPMWRVVRHPLCIDSWLVQITIKENGNTNRYLQEVKDV